MAKNRQQTEEKLNYLVTDRQGSFVLEIPAKWKLTFAAVNPASTGPRGEYCLRVYEGEKLRAVFCDVKSFRDLAIPMARKIQKETGNATWTKDSAGNFDHSIHREVVELTEGENPFLDDDGPDLS